MLLGAVLRRVRTAQQLLRVDPVVGRDRHADAAGERHVAPTDAHRRVAGGRDALGEHHRELAARQVGEQHRQLVAPVPSEGVLDAEAVANALRDRAQHLVAGRVAEGIVDQLELVDVDEAHADGGVVDTCVQQGLLEAVEEHRPRWKTRQGIVLESPARGLLRHPQLGQVDRDSVAHGRAVSRLLRT